MSDGVSVGLHLGERTASAVQVERERGRKVLRRIGETALPMELTPDVLLAESARTEVAGALRDLFEAAGIDGQPVCVSVGGNFSVVKRVPLEVASEKERREQIAWEAAQYLVDPVDEYSVDYHAFGRSAFLVAIRKPTAEACARICEEAGLGLKRLEVDPLCLYFAAVDSSGRDGDDFLSSGGSVVHFGGRWATCIATSGTDLASVELVRLDRGGRRRRSGPEEEREEGFEAAVRPLGRRLAGGPASERVSRPDGPRRVQVSGDLRTAEAVVRSWGDLDLLRVRLLDPFACVDPEGLPEDQKPLLEGKTRFAVCAGAAYKNL